MQIVTCIDKDITNLKCQLCLKSHFSIGLWSDLICVCSFVMNKCFFDLVNRAVSLISWVSVSESWAYGSWVKCLMGHIGHGSKQMTHSQLGLHCRPHEHIFRALEYEF